DRDPCATGGHRPVAEGVERVGRPECALEGGGGPGAKESGQVRLTGVGAGGVARGGYPTDAEGRITDGDHRLPPAARDSDAVGIAPRANGRADIADRKRSVHGVEVIRPSCGWGRWR